VNLYLNAVVLQLLARVRYLIGLIPRDLPRDVHSLVLTARSQLDTLAERLRMLDTDPKLLLPENESTRLRGVRRVIGDLDLLETVAIAVLNRWNNEDTWLNTLVDDVAREIAYPLPTPIVAGQSQQYYATYPALNLVVVPLAESRFLLHLPDLYHELAHPLLTTRNDPNLEPFQNALVRAYTTAIAHVAEELRAEGARRGPAAYQQYLRCWTENWWSWVIELFSDLFAAFTVGPAFGWSHFHLTAARGTPDPYAVPLFTQVEHPNDGVRMAAILFGLRRIGFDAEAGAIEAQWKRFLTCVQIAPTPEHERCFPDSLVSRIAEFAHAGTLNLGCRIARRGQLGAVGTMLNDAWSQLWTRSSTYAEWEAKAIETYRAKLQGRLRAS
jgi:hypothetical protein